MIQPVENQNIKQITEKVKREKDQFNFYFKVEYGNEIITTIIQQNKVKNKYNPIFVNLNISPGLNTKTYDITAQSLIKIDYTGFDIVFFGNLIHLNMNKQNIFSFDVHDLYDFDLKNLQQNRIEQYIILPESPIDRFNIPYDPASDELTIFFNIQIELIYEK